MTNRETRRGGSPAYHAGRRMLETAIRPHLRNNVLVLGQEPEFVDGKFVDGAYRYDVAGDKVLRATVVWGGKSYEDNVRFLVVDRPCSVLWVAGEERDSGSIDHKLITSFLLSLVE